MDASASPAKEITPERLAGGLALAGGALLALGSLLPWLSASAPLIGTITRSGMDYGDGKITVVVGLATGAIGLLLLLGTLSMTRSTAGWLLAVALLVGGGTAIYDYTQVQGRIDDATTASDLIVASIGIGLWLVLAALPFLAAACYVAFSGWTPSRAPSGTKPPAPPTPPA